MEERIIFQSHGCGLVGALHTPEGSQSPLGLVLLHGWAGYRIGAHRMFVKLARQACRRGLPCLRFDFRGRGDSEGDMAEATLSTMIADTQVAAQVLMSHKSVERVALVGDCSGSEVAIGVAPLLERCAAQVLWSAPIVGASREGTDRAKRRHVIAQYWSKLWRVETWKKLLSGGLQPQMILRALRGGGKGAGEEGSVSDREIDWLGRFRSFRGEVLFIYGSADPTAQQALAHYQQLTREAGRVWHHHVVAGANHAFYSLAWEQEVIAASLDWLARLPAAAGEG